MNAVRGVHHLALNTDDMKMTIDFYAGVLGMPLIHAMRVPPGLGTGAGNRGNPPFENLRHYFFDMGNDSTVAFFEIPKGAKPRGDRDAIATMQHLAFATSAEGAADLLERLERSEIANSGVIVTLPGLHSVYFFDPNGIRLEFAWRPVDHADDIHVIDSVPQSEDDARAELQTLSDDPEWIERAVAYWQRNYVASRSASSNSS
jgi:catechol 2,3-dioxygenase-like lactoylglutathione lyase family enzyme